MGRALRLLLDTHIYYWWTYQEDRLSPRALFFFFSRRLRLSYVLLASKDV